MPPPLRPRRLLFVTGKGGVGKTTVTVALARSLARGGHRVLVCAVEGGRDVADAVGLSRVGFVPTLVDDRLSVMAIDTEASLREYLRIHLKIPIIGRVGPLATAFDFVATAAPGVREILTIGKVCYEARERHYDTVVVDAPATGHVVGYLAAPVALRQLVRVGPVLAQTEWMGAMLADEVTTGVIVVSTPEEMPVAESIELLAAIREQTACHVAAVVANRVPPGRFAPADAAIVAALRSRRPPPFDASDAGVIFDAVGLDAARRDAARDHLATLRAAAGSVPLVIQPEVIGAATARRVIAAVATSFDEEIA